MKNLRDLVVVITGASSGIGLESARQFASAGCRTVLMARASDRLTESAVCLVATEHGPDLQLQKMLQGAGRIEGAAKPILEINPSHALIAALASCPAEDGSFREDAVKLLFDQARVLDGDKPEDPRGFAERLSRVFGRALKG